MKGRAVTPEQKRELLDRIYEVWCDKSCSELRLGQLIGNATELGWCTGNRLFYVEDSALIDELWQFARRPQK